MERSRRLRTHRLSLKVREQMAIGSMSAEAPRSDPTVFVSVNDGTTDIRHLPVESTASDRRHTAIASPAADAAGAGGTVNENVAPVARRSAHSRPPCASMIDRLIERPIPVPPPFVV